MGIDPISIGIIVSVASLAVGVVGGVAAQNSANQAAAAQQEANKVQAAQTQITSQEDVRQKVREERIRRAQIISASTSQGSDASSGEAGAIGSLETNFGNMVSQSQSQSNSNTFINRYNQEATDASESGNTIKAMTTLTQNSLDTFGSIFEPKQKTTY